MESNNKPNPVVKIGITGGIRSGKDTVAEYIQELIDLYYVNPTIRVLGFADGIRDLIDTFLPDISEGGKPRKALQGIGQHLRTYDPDVWVKYAIQDIRLTEATFGDTHIIVKDVRQPNEAEALRKEGFTIIKILADRDERIARATNAGDVFDVNDFNHETEKEVDYIIPDVIIYNDTTLEELKDTVGDFLREYQNNGYIEGE